MNRDVDLVLRWPDGRETTVATAEDETVLEAAESTGVSLPFGCRTGACSSCVARLVDGEVTHGRPPRALRPRHIEAGYVLCCVARPREDCLLSVGPSIQHELFPNPWR